MNTDNTAEETENFTEISIGLQLAELREQKGYTQEYVAGKLHLRVRVIELLEADDFEGMPESVFIKGYIRAYALLLGIDPKPYIEKFNQLHKIEKRVDNRTLWQSRKTTNSAEKWVRWFTLLVAISVITIIGIWWHKSKDSQISSVASSDTVIETSEPKLRERLTDISKMHSFASKENKAIKLENERG